MPNDSNGTERRLSSRSVDQLHRRVPGAALRPWFELVDQLRAEKGLSQDDLAYEARQHGAPSTLTGSWVSQLKKGKRPLAADVLRGIAGALGVPPETFAEYRLAMARRELDEKEVGLERAVANLTALAESVAQGGLPGPPPGELEQLLTAVSPNSTDLGRPGSEDEPSARRRRRAA